MAKFFPSPFITLSLIIALKLVTFPVQSQIFPDWISVVDHELLQSPQPSIKADLVVAQDGRGDYKTISEAATASLNLRNDSTTRFVIYVKAGVYEEYVNITSDMKNLTFIGDGINATVVTGSKNVVDGGPNVTTHDTATFAVKGHGFIARDMTFENTAGPFKNQAVALLSQSNLTVFYRCSFKGYQDTLYAFSHIQFYRNCDIYGTVDFIFGDATAVFQECNIYVRKPRKRQQNIVTAHGRKDPKKPSGFVIQDSVVEATSELKPVQGSFPTYLGRPWKDYSRTVFINTTLGSLINPAGWLAFDGNTSNLDTLYYGEYMNTGLGASTTRRVKWLGYHNLSEAEAQNFTVRNFLSGDLWIPETRVPYKSGL